MLLPENSSARFLGCMPNLGIVICSIQALKRGKRLGIAQFRQFGDARQPYLRSLVRQSSNVVGNNSLVRAHRLQSPGLA